MQTAARAALAATVTALLALHAPASAQHFTRLSRGAEDMAPLEYKALSDSASRLLDQQEWAAAAALYTRLVNAYPVDPMTAYNLGIAQARSGNPLAAARALSSAYWLGTPIEARGTAARVAAEYARANEPDSAMAWLHRAILEAKVESPVAVFADTAFTPLRDDPRFLRLAPPRAGGLTRAEGLRLDVDYLLDWFERYNEARDPVPDSVRAAASALKQRIGSMTDWQALVEMQRLVAVLGRGHNGFIFSNARSTLGPAPFPLRGYLFGGDVYVIRSDSAHLDLVGGRILAVEGTETPRLLDSLAALVPGEGETRRAMVADLLLIPEFLHGAGMAASPDRLRLRIVDRAGVTREVEVATGKHPVPSATLWTLLGSGPPPLYRSRLGNAFWFEPLAAESTMYVRFAPTLDKEDETLAAFGLRLRAYLEQHPELRGLVVDVRGNGGGNTYLYTELLRTVIAFDARAGNRTFVLIDRETYSAGINFVIDVERLTNALLLGEPTGGSVEQHGDASVLTLPYSGRIFVISSAIWNISSPRDDRKYIAPDVPVELTPADLLANRDPVLETVLAIIRNR
jgi:hypothetical protein